MKRAEADSLSEEVAPPIDEAVWNRMEPLSRRRLLVAALDCFSERGYFGTTTRDISARAGLSNAAIYMHYKSKAELLDLIMFVTHSEILREMQAAANRHQMPQDRMYAVVRAHVVFHAHRHTAALVANHELAASPAEFRERILKLRADIEDVVQDVVLQGVRMGVFAITDIRATTFGILSLGIGVSRWFEPGGRLTAEELGDIYARDVLNMLVSEGSHGAIGSNKPSAQAPSAGPLGGAG